MKVIFFFFRVRELIRSEKIGLGGIQDCIIVDLVFNKIV